MSNNPTIMIVDDAEDSRSLHRMLLGEHYSIIEAASGEDCIEKVSQEIPNLILLDINMGGMNGYDTCLHLRKQSATATLPIIVVSAMYKPEERLQGYEAGANDYMVKPIEGPDLLKRVANQLVNQLSLANAQKSAKDSMNAAMEAITYSGEMGQLMELVKKSQNAKTMSELAGMVCETISEFGINACALIKCSDTNEVFSGCDPYSIEADVLRKGRGSKKSIVNVGIRTIVKTDHICLLIKNMPVDDENRYGRIKDHLSVIVRICDGPILALKAQQELASQRGKVMETMITVAEEKVAEFNAKLSKHDQEIFHIAANMVSELEGMLFSLGLDEDQEKKLMALAYSATDQLNETKESTRQLESDLNIIVEGLYVVAQT